MIEDRLYLRNQELTFSAFSKKQNEMIKIKGKFSGTFQIRQPDVLVNFLPNANDEKMLTKELETILELECTAKKIEITEDSK